MSNSKFQRIVLTRRSKHTDLNEYANNAAAPTDDFFPWPKNLVLLRVIPRQAIR